jgi:hypothetical protein
MLPVYDHRMAAGAFLVWCWMTIPDALNIIGQGILRGAGHQMVAAKINLSIEWLVGVPIGAALGFGTSLGLKGLFLGNAIAITGVGVCNWIYITWKVDWKAEVKRAEERLAIDDHIRNRDRKTSITSRHGRTPSDASDDSSSHAALPPQHAHGINVKDAHDHSTRASLTQPLLGSDTSSA